MLGTNGTTYTYSIKSASDLYLVVQNLGFETRVIGTSGRIST